MNILGCIVDDKTHEKFVEALPDNITTAEAMEWFVWQIINGEMHIEKVSNE